MNRSLKCALSVAFLFIGQQSRLAVAQREPRIHIPGISSPTSERDGVIDIDLPKISPPELSTNGQRNTTQPPTHTSTAPIVPAPVAFYIFFRTIAVPSTGTDLEKAMSTSMIAKIGLSSGDQSAFTSIARSYGDVTVRVSAAKNTAEQAKAQKESEQAFVTAVQHIRQDMSSAGIATLRAHVEEKRSRMQIHHRGEQ